MLANARKSTTAWCRLTSSWSANRLCLQMLRVWPSTENLPRSRQNSELFAHRQPRCHWPCRADEARMFCPLTRSFSSCRRQLACLRYRLFSPGRARFRARRRSNHHCGVMIPLTIHFPAKPKTRLYSTMRCPYQKHCLSSRALPTSLNHLCCLGRWMSDHC